MAFDFEWDPVKDRSNLAKHGISFVLATAVFDDPRSIPIPDPDHSLAERRQIVLGKGAAWRS